MKQENYTAILLRATDYRENDKLVRLLTLDSGIITAVMKGVKKPKAKLKFGAQQFAFCEYTLVTNASGFSTVISCIPIEDLFTLTSNFDKYICASLMLECAEIATGESKSEKIFILLLKCLKEIMFSNISEKLICAFFIEKLLISGGYITQKNEFFTNIVIVPQLLSTLSTLSNEKFEALFSTNTQDEENCAPIVKGDKKITVDNKIIEKSLRNVVSLFEDSFNSPLKSYKLIKDD